MAENDGLILSQVRQFYLCHIHIRTGIGLIAENDFSKKIRLPSAAESI